MSIKLFGTDGIRGKYPDEISSDFALEVGKAIASVFSLSPEPTKIVIGRDTRASGPTLERALAKGLHQMGVHSYHVGVVPSGCISYLTEKNDFAAGVVISASHNPHEYNGIKVFAANGFKSSEEYESKIEQLVFSKTFTPVSTKRGKSHQAKRLNKQFEFFLRQQLPEKPLEHHFAIDCANGAAYEMAKKVFRDYEHTIYLFDDPNGTNINVGCGATNLKALSAYVKDNKLDFGISFDGDADRMLAVDESGNIIDGDMLLFAFAKQMKAEGRLLNNAIACTTLSNCGLAASLEELGIQTHITDVGDKAVSNNMLKNNLALGGEQSGHIILLKAMKTGDGLLTACKLMQLVSKTKLPFSSLFDGFAAFPQVQINIKVQSHQKSIVLNNPSLQQQILQAEGELCNYGRVLVRASGTEPLLRVLVEGKDKDQILGIAKSLAALIETIAKDA